MINEDRMLKTLTFVNVHKHIKALFIMIIKWLGIIDDTLEKKADLIGGKVPAEQLPFYVDSVIDITSFVTKTELVNNIGQANYTNKSFIVNSPTSDPLYNKIVITNANTSQNDWEIIDPEDGKIYINESNNHSYRWSGNSFVDLDKNFNDRLNAIENKLSIITLSGLTNNYDLSTTTNGISTLKAKLLNNDNSANILLKIVDTNNKSYYCKILTRDITTVSTNISVNIDIENKGCIQTYNITDDNITLINNNAILFITSNTNNNKLECNKIISNVTTAHISYNNIIYTQVDLSDINSVRFIGYNSNGILNYYALNKSTGVVQAMNTYNIGKTCLYKANLSLTDNEKQNIKNNIGISSETQNNLFIDITGKVENITDELHNQIINTPAIIFNNVIYFKTSTANGNTIYFINYEENGDLSELIYTIASKSFTTNSVSNTIINKEISIDKTMNNITPIDIFTTNLLQTIDIIKNANRLNIIVKDSSSMKQTLTILNVSKTLQNGDAADSNYSMTFTFNDIIYYANIENNIYNGISSKTLYSLLYSNSGGNGGAID
jgi:hypothetical protein